jgi:hypothetical protein
MNYYPTQVFIFEQKKANLYHIGCRPDALATLCADLLNIDPSAGPIRVGSVETRGDEVASFLLKIEIPPFLQKKFMETIDKYRTAI